ncbi:HET-domain-containing protein, partial [Thozetella sp. PMI_491]
MPLSFNTESEPRNWKPHTYNELDSSKQQIRLLELLPPSQAKGLPLNNLITVSLDEKPHYDALSYVWGTAIPESQILLADDTVLVIGRNLKNAIEDLRLSDRPRTIWIDAICIDQQNLTEKSHQIRAMRQIFSHAREVRAWM